MSLLTEIMTIASDNDFTLAKNLIALALADGTINEEEKKALTKICADINISKEGCIEFLNAQTKPDLSILSATIREKEDYLVKMIQVMGADGRVPLKKSFCWK